VGRGFRLHGFFVFYACDSACPTKAAPGTKQPKHLPEAVRPKCEGIRPGDGNYVVNADSFGRTRIPGGATRCALRPTLAGSLLRMAAPSGTIWMSTAFSREQHRLIARAFSGADEPPISVTNASGHLNRPCEPVAWHRET